MNKMNNDIKKFQKAYLLFALAQFFIILSLFSYGGNIKALSELFFLFDLFAIVGSILMIMAATRLVFINRNCFYFFVSTMFYFFISLLATFGSESTEDLTVAIARGLRTSSTLLICMVYVYFFLGTRDYFKENGLTGNIKSSKLGYIWVITCTALLMIIGIIKPWNSVKTNYVLTSILRYGSLLLELALYVFVLVILIMMLIYMKKKNKEMNDHGKEE